MISEITLKNNAFREFRLLRKFRIDESWLLPQPQRELPAQGEMLVLIT